MLLAWPSVCHSKLTQECKLIEPEEKIRFSSKLKRDLYIFFNELWFYLVIVIQQRIDSLLKFHQKFFLLRQLSDDYFEYFSGIHGNYVILSIVDGRILNDLVTKSTWFMDELFTEYLNLRTGWKPDLCLLRIPPCYGISSFGRYL